MKADETYLLHTTRSDWSTIRSEDAVAIIEAVPFERGTAEDGSMVFQNKDGSPIAAIVWLEIGIQLQVLSNNEAEVDQLVESLIAAITETTADEVNITEIN